MFGHKKDTIKVVPLSVKIQSMPAEFYGGANPVVVFHDVKKNVSFGQQSNLSKAEKTAYNQTTAVGNTNPQHATNLLMNSKFIIVGGISLFLLFVLGASGYYWYQNRQSALSQLPTPPITNVVVETPVAPVVEDTIIVPEVASSTTPVLLADNALIEFPVLGLSNSVDSDTDGLSDAAEELFKTNLDLPDSDSDSFSDANEIFYLYNPAGKEPMKLIDAETVVVYDNPVFNYTLYYPLNWAVGNTKEDYRDILFSTLGGDNIEVLTVDKEPGQDFSSWFLQNVPNQQLSDYRPFESRLGATGWERSDKLVYFIVTPARIYILAYHVSETNIVNYQIVLNMMARSFKLPLFAGNTAPLEVINQTVTTTSPVTLDTVVNGLLPPVVSTTTF